MKITKREYQNMSRRAAPSSPLWRDCVNAFWIGGLLCAAGQGVVMLAEIGGMPLKEARLLCSVVLVAFSALLTGCNIYDNLARRAGAGTLVPITGFANAVASAALEFKSEGWILGLGAKIFTVAGPVLVYGVTASTVYGLILYIVGLF